jgi:3-phosphoshikimate 1-carboxyvinyltransferase
VNRIVEPSKGLRGEITVSPDKSISHRALMLGAMAQGRTIIENFSFGEDCIATLECLKDLGIDIEIKNNTIDLKGKGRRGFRTPGGVLDARNSGTTMRLLSGILAGQNFESVITGDRSLQNRPMDRIIKPLALMGARIDNNKGKAPLKIKGQDLKGIDYKMEVSSAQVKSSILLAALNAQGPTKIKEKDSSRNHTERMIKFLGGNINYENDWIYLVPDNELRGDRIEVVGDISSAAFFIVGALILKSSDLLIRNVGINQTRMGMIKYLKIMGAEIDIHNKRMQSNEEVADIYVVSSKLKGITIESMDIATMIDEIPILAVACAIAEGKTVIRGVGELRYKESNRLDAMICELNKMGANIWCEQDDLHINGVEKLKAAQVNSHNDHRIAMSLSVAALSTESISTINDSQWVNISYPDFFSTLQKVCY